MMNVHFPRPQNWIDKDLGTLKYVDDFLAHEKIALVNGYLIISETKQKRVIHAKKCEEFFDTVKTNAQRIGMTVNDKKTQLLCMSAARDSTVSSYIRLGNGNKIESQSSLKILGFHFSSAPTIDTHVENLKLSFRRRLWMLRHLRKAAVPDSDLVHLYKVFLLSLLDYACVVYNSMLTITQSHAIENLQKAALRICLLYTSPSPRDRQKSRMPSSA